MTSQKGAMLKRSSAVQSLHTDEPMRGRFTAMINQGGVTRRGSTREVQRIGSFCGGDACKGAMPGPQHAGCPSPS